MEICILNCNLEKNAHRNEESVTVRGAHFKPRCNFLPSYRIMLLLGHDQLQNLQKGTNLQSCIKPNAL